MKLKWRNFKGLYTNIDASDKGVEYFSKFKDIKVYPGYIESKGLSFEEESYGIPEGHTFVRQQYVFLDEDKYQNIKIGANFSAFIVDSNDILADGIETSGQEHTYTIEIIASQYPNPFDDTSYFKWKVDNGNFSEPIAISMGGTNYTQSWFSVLNGLKIKFTQVLYTSTFNNVKKWTIKSIVDSYSELENNYVQNIQKYLFQISYSNGNYHFFINGEEVNNSPFADSPHQYPKIINEKGILKVLMKSRALWIGKINRSYWNRNGTLTNIPEGFYVYPLVEGLPGGTFGKLFNFDLQSEQNVTNIIPVTTRLFSDNYAFQQPLYGQLLRSVAYELLDINGNTVPFSNADGFLLLPRMVNLTIDSNNNFGKYFYAFWTGHTEISPHPTTGIHIGEDVTPNKDGWTFLWNIRESDTKDGFWQGTGSFADGNQWIFFQTDKDWTIPQSLTDWLSRTDLTVDLGKIASEHYFDPGQDIEFLTTVFLNNSEYPIDYQSLKSLGSPFIIRITPGVDMDYIYKNKITANIYFRYRNNITDVNDKEFEFCYGVQFTIGKPENYTNKYINKLTPNGIFLTQMIGKFFDPSTYKIITAFDDYANVAGVPYILKNSNVHYPAVGGGAILNNFYYENVVPGIEGERLIAFANLLGVFSGTRELMTLIDFSPVESSMIFYIKDTLEYKVKDEKDLIETPEGTFIHLKEGVYITNGRERTLISEPINDIVKRYYSSSNIFYNSYHKQLFYIVMNSKVSALYCFDFETQSWSEYSLPRNYDSKNPIIDFIEDYEGNIYFITKAESYKLSYIAKSGELELSYIDLQEYSISKRINYLAADHTGTIEAVGIAKNENNNPRGIRYLFNRLANRKPIKDIVVGIKFNGSLYGVEMDIETMRTEQL